MPSRHRQSLFRAACAAACLTLAATAALPDANAQTPARFRVPATDSNARWFKGNTHTHTLNSDGDSPPEEVARWYKSHGYAFLVLSDHNVFTDPRTLATLMDSSFLLVPGEEVTTSFQKAAVHVNALSIDTVIAPIKDSTLLGTVQRTIDNIRRVNAVPHINHPNFLWSIDTATLFRVRNDKLFEIYNGHPTVHNLGGGDWPGMEEAWDALLTRGRPLFGIAVDDAHTFKGEFTPRNANPGRGWIVIRSAQLQTASLMRALELGQFYASTGVELDDVSVTDSTLTLRIRPRGDFKYTTQFIGSDGQVLAVDKSLTPRYQLRGKETYVRAKVIDSGGAAAWVQPAFTSLYSAINPL